MLRRPRPPPFYLLMCNLMHGCSFTVPRCIPFSIRLHLCPRNSSKSGRSTSTPLEQWHLYRLESCTLWILNEIINYEQRTLQDRCSATTQTMCEIVNLNSNWNESHLSGATSVPNRQLIRAQVAIYRRSMDRKWILHVISTVSGRE